MGTGTNATWSTVEQTKAAVRWGADALLVVTPYYNKPPQAGLLRHYEEVAKAAGGRPVIAYDVPGRTSVMLAEETVRQLAAVPGLVALKDATGDVDRIGRLAGTPLTLLSGDDALTLRSMEKGAVGVISVAANVVPEAMARLCEARDAASHERLTPLFKALFVESNPIPVKFALARMGRLRNELRLPLVPLSARHEPAVLDALALAGAL
jgi:4-hydroxy-tetrahydrodipicolinate synthase